MNIRDIVSPVADAYNLLAAGMDTTSYTLSCATFYLLESPQCANRLQQELAGAGLSSPELLDLKKIQNLPYLVRYHWLLLMTCRHTDYWAIYSLLP